MFKSEIVEAQTLESQRKDQKLFTCSLKYKNIRFCDSYMSQKRTYPKWHHLVWLRPLNDVAFISDQEIPSFISHVFCFSP